MRTHVVHNLKDCAEYRQAMEVKPANTARRSGFLLLALLAAAVAWSWMTQVDLVVRARGLVRPVSQTSKVINTTDGQKLSATIGSRVTEVHYRVGDRVSRGDLLVRLDTGHLDNDIIRQQRAVKTAQAQYARLLEIQELGKSEYEVNKAKLEAELQQAETQIQLESERRILQTRVAEATLKQMNAGKARADELQAAKAISVADYEMAVVKLAQAQEALAKAQLPVNEQQRVIVQRTISLEEKKHSVRESELSLRLEMKQGEINTTELELANLQLEKQQSELRAPSDGVVITGEIKVGDTLEQGKTVIELADAGDFIFEAWIPTEDVGHLSLGLPANIKLDAYHYQTYGTASGKVTFVAPDSRLQGPSDRQVAAYQVRIEMRDHELKHNSLRGDVKLGMAGSVEIVTEQRSLLTVFFRRIRRSISLG
jgi:hemolysin D